MKLPLVNPDLAFRKIGDETFILDTKLNKEVHQLNEVGSFIWNLCDGKHEVSDIVDLVCDEFVIDTDLARQDIDAFMKELMSKTLILEASL